MRRKSKFQWFDWVWLSALTPLLIVIAIGFYYADLIARYGWEGFSTRPQYDLIINWILVFLFYTPLAYWIFKIGKNRWERRKRL